MATARAAFLRFSLRSTLSSFSGKQTKALPVNVLLSWSYISFQNCLKSTMLPWPRANLLGSVCKAANYKMCWTGSKLAGTLSFANSHPVNLSSCAWKYFSARPVPVCKWPCSRTLLRTEWVIRIIACSLREWRWQRLESYFYYLLDITAWYLLLVLRFT